MKYATRVNFFDNGKVTASVFPCDDDQKTGSKTMRTHDEYIDVFDTKQEAEKWKKEAFKA